VMAAIWIARAAPVLRTWRQEPRADMPQEAR